MPDRTATDQYFAMDDQLRRQMHAEYTLGEAEDPPAAVPVVDEVAQTTVPPVSAPAGAGAPAPVATAPAAASKVALNKLVSVRCSKDKVVVKLKAGLKEALVGLGKAKPKLLRRGSLSLRGRGKLTVRALGKGGQRFVAGGAAPRCRR
jgi:hypothetical protein